jgi:HTH-type transcriptional regulator/antitoxin HigA
MERDSMRTGARTRKKVKVPEGFHELNALFPLMPLKDEVDLDNALEAADRLAVLDRRTHEQEAYLSTLSLLIERYEDVHHSIDARRDPIGNLRFLLKQHGLSASQLGSILGQRQPGSKVLNRKRQLSKAHIQKLCRYFRVGPGAFLKI